MKRLVLLLTVPLLASAPTWEAGNAYALKYHVWATLRNIRVQSPGTVSAPEMVEWQKVKSAWRQLEKQVDAEYR